MSEWKDWMERQRQFQLEQQREEQRERERQERERQEQEERARWTEEQRRAEHDRKIAAIQRKLFEDRSRGKR